MSGKKKLVYVVLLLLALILPGCAPGPSDTEASTVGTSVAAESTAALSSEEAETLPQPERMRMESVPDYNGTILIEPDPDRKFYCTLANVDCDLYEDTSFTGLQFFIITTEEYSLSDIHITLPIQSIYSVDIDNWTEYQYRLCDSLTGWGFDLHHFLVMQGLDFKVLGQEAMDALYAGEDSMQYSSIDERFWNLQAISDAYNEKIRGYQAEFQKITAEDLPEAYFYNVNIIFYDENYKTNYVEETVTQMEITLGEETYTIDFGELRIHDTLPEEIQRDNYGLFQSQVAVISISDTAYASGYVQISEAFSFTAKQDLTVTGARIYGADIDLLGGCVYMDYDGSRGLTSATCLWDGSIPLEIAAGQSVCIDIFLHDERFTQYEIDCSAVLIMDYEVDGIPHYMTIPCRLTRDNNMWDTYLMAFEGIDMGEYYTCFYNPQFSLYVYDSDLPESWRR